MNPLSSIGTEAINSQESGVVFITLLTITHPLLSAPIYLSSDPTTRMTAGDTTISSGGDSDVESDTDSGTDTDDLAGTMITLPGNGQPYYGTESRGNFYVFLPFQGTRPDDRGDQVATASISIDNIGVPTGVPGQFMKISDVLAVIGTTPPSVLIEVVTNETPDVLEGDSFTMVLRDTTDDAYTVSGRLGFEEILDEPWPPRTVEPNTLPGVFAIAG